MGAHDTPDTPGVTGVQEAGDSQGEYVVYYDYPLDQAHDEQGYSAEPDDSGAWARLYDVRPTLLQRLWWRSRWIVYLGSFSIPLLMLAVLLLIGRATHANHPSAASNESTRTPAPLMTGDWPPEIDYAQNTVPAMIRNDLPLAGMKQGYLFYGTAGRTWRITAAPDDESALDPQITLYAPSGALLQQNDNRSPDTTEAEIVIVLPENGAYRLVIEAAAPGLTTGKYLLTLFEQ